MKPFSVIASSSFILLALICQGCGEGRMPQKKQDGTILTARDLERVDTVTKWNRARLMEENTVPMKVNHVGNYATVFHDGTDVHDSAANRIGIPVLTDMRSHWNLPRPLVKVTSCRDFFVDPLTHSVPYLVPEAADILHEIGRRFADSVAARGGSQYRLRVTSITRTPESVGRLRKVNKNAIANSVHQRATTFDISYARFIPDANNTVNRSVDDLKGVLAEVLLAMRREGKIYVIYERRQPCFHITARSSRRY